MLFPLEHSELSAAEKESLKRVEELSEDEFHTITTQNYDYNKS